MASCIWFTQSWYFRWKSLWRDRTSLKALYRLSIDFTCMRPTIEMMTRLKALLPVNWSTWERVARAIMAMLWKFFSSILSVPSSFDLRYIQTLGLRGCCNNSPTVHIYCVIYGRSLRSCFIFFSVTVGLLVTKLWSFSRDFQKEVHF